MAYTGTIIKDLDLTKPTDGSTIPSEINDAIREVKVVLKNLSTIVTKTASGSVVATDEVILCNSASPITLDLPQASTLGSSTFTKSYTFVNINSGVVTIDAYSSETINGATTKTLDTQYSFIKLYTQGTNWIQVIEGILDGAITAAKLASNAVETTKIKDANVTAVKLAADVAGAGLATTSGVLSVNVDGSTLEVTTDTLNVKALGIAAAQLATDAVETAKIKDANVTTAKIATAAVTGVKMARSITQILPLAALTACTVSNPSGTITRINKTGHGLVTGYNVTLSQFSSWLNNSYVITVVDADNFDLDGAVWETTADTSGTVTPKQTTFITDDIVIIDSAGSKTVDLYPVSGNTGRILTICRLGAGAVVIDGSGSETIESNGSAATTMTLTNTITVVGSVTMTEACRSVTLLCTGTEWMVIAREVYVSIAAT